MEIYKISDFKGGWFVGDFEPTVYKNREFEAGFKVHLKDEVWPKHYHKDSLEINYLVSGKMLIQGKELNSGDVFVIRPGEIADPIFIEECKVFIIKTPSIPGDKFLVG
jgi:quercetin dioxygenase-like cupin family protein